MSRRRHRLDSNHKAIRQALEASGWLFEDCSQTNLGYDAIVSKAGRSVKLEIKDGSLSESRRQLTPHEKEVQETLARFGIAVELITCVEDLAILERTQRDYYK